MTRRIVLGFDDGAESRDAARLARLLAGIEGTEVVVVVSFDYAPLPVTVVEHERALFKAAERVFQAATRELGDTQATMRAVAASSPARALDDVAGAVGAEMIVIGSTHRGRLGRVYPGSVGERLLHGAPSAVAVAPRGYAMAERVGVDVVGIGYDGTIESRRAASVGARIAAGAGGSVKLIRVMGPLDPDPALAPYASEVRDKLESDLEDAVRAVRDEIGGERLTLAVEPRLLEGDPAATLADAGPGLDLLVVGSRGYGPLLRTLLGGVSSKLIRTSPCPVLVVPRGSEGAREPESVRELEAPKS
jgi:nucleotide-binding universal stress UspA family protein